MKLHPQHPGYFDILPEGCSEYFEGLRIASVEYPEFAIVGEVGEPGSHYRHYSIVRLHEGQWGFDEAVSGVCGIVGSKETIDEAKNAIADLANRNVKPIPFLNSLEPTRFPVADGHQVEVMIMEVEIMDEQVIIAHCAIFDATGNVVAATTLSALESLVDIRDNAEYLYAVIAASKIINLEEQDLMNEVKLIDKCKKEDIHQTLAAMDRNETCKVIVDGGFELFLTKKVSEIIRKPDGQKIPYFTYLPSAPKGSTIGLEEVFDLKIRKLSGYYFEEKKGVSLDLLALSEVIEDSPNNFVSMNSNKFESILDKIDGGNESAKLIGQSRIYKEPKISVKSHQVDDGPGW